MKILKYLEEHNVKNIHLCGYSDKVFDYLEESKICLLYSQIEAFANCFIRGRII